jgi:hypothetical protein
VRPVAEGRAETEQTRGSADRHILQPQRSLRLHSQSGHAGQSRSTTRGLYLYTRKCVCGDMRHETCDMPYSRGVPTRHGLGDGAPVLGPRVGADELGQLRVLGLAPTPALDGRVERHLPPVTALLARAACRRGEGGNRTNTGVSRSTHITAAEVPPPTLPEWTCRAVTKHYAGPIFVHAQVCLWGHAT